jgi:NADH-ubiquinone oxidoreductase chain 5
LFFLALFGVFLFFCFSFFYVFYEGGFVFDLFFFTFCGLDFSFSFVFDFLSLGFGGCVSLISSVVFFYRLFYMEGTVDARRFLWLVFLFVVSMFFLVFSGNFFTTMIGWDGLGLTSFCLVVFYNNRVRLDSGLITVFSNRVGDVFFLLSFFLFLESGQWGFDLFFSSVPFWFLVFLFFGRITKRAQVPFSAWLPAAIAAPTPVSSLVHSSTLVTAGVFVLIRYHYLFFFGGRFFLFFSLGTMLLAGFCACIEKDYKKVIAMSTLSQLGMMLFILSVGCWVLSFLHMVVHAFFKSTLFLRRGSMISQLGGGQDSRFYGGFSRSSVSYVYLLVRCFSLAGFPFVVGFYSKDSIISYFSGIWGGFCFFVFLLGCIFTVGYRFRLMHSGFYSVFNYSSSVSSSESVFFVFPVFFLFLICVYGGSLLRWFFLSGFSVFLRGFDLFWGAILIFLGLLFFAFLRVSFHLLNFFSRISFLRWIRSGGVSSFFRRMVFYRGESSWIEVVGGIGFFGFLFHLSKLFSFFIGLGFKTMMVLVFLLSLFFHMCAVSLLDVGFEDAKFLCMVSLFLSQLWKSCIFWTLWECSFGLFES